jgi:non-specific serine/threonine protein kinase
MIFKYESSPLLSRRINHFYNCRRYAKFSLPFAPALISLSCLPAGFLLYKSFQTHLIFSGTNRRYYTMIGKIVSHYKILARLGGGGMGVVYKARDTKLNRSVALKFLPPTFAADSEMKKRFYQEAQIVSALQHNNICAIHEINETDDGQIYIVMDCYEGVTLKEKVKAERVNIKKAIDYTIQIAQGLQKAHERGIVHRDIKPANIIITNDDDVKILDFGLAKFWNQKEITKTGQTPGTIAYMSPEQIWGNKIDCRTDIWSLGILLFEMLTREIPFEGNIDQALMYSISKEKPKSLTDLNNKVPESLEQIVFKTLEKDPEKRYQNTGELLNDLQSWKNLIIDVGIKTKMFSKIRAYRYAGSALILLIILSLFYLFKPDFTNYEYRKVIAVFPFENLSFAKEYEYYSAAITEDIRQELCKISSLRILSRESIDEYKKLTFNISGVGEENDAGTILKGSAKRTEGRVTMAVHLHDTRTNEVLWEKNYNKMITNIFDIRSDIIDNIALALDIELTLNEKKRLAHKPTVNMIAYDYYLRGGEYLYHGNLHKAIDSYKRAFSLDPSYVQAYISLTHLYNYGTWIVILSGN